MTGHTFGKSFITVCLTAFVGIAGCGGDDDPTAPPMIQPPPAPTRVVKANPSLANDIQEIFNRLGCSGGSCHGAAQSAGLNLGSASAAFTSLVGVSATSESIVRVIPNDADNSYLVIKLEGRQSVGARMPLGGGMIDTVDLNNIKNWINTGAANN